MIQKQFKGQMQYSEAVCNKVFIHILSALPTFKVWSELVACPMLFSSPVIRPTYSRLK